MGLGVIAGFGLLANSKAIMQAGHLALTPNEQKRVITPSEAITPLTPFIFRKFQFSPSATPSLLHRDVVRVRRTPVGDRH